MVFPRNGSLFVPPTGCAPKSPAADGTFGPVFVAVWVEQDGRMLKRVFVVSLWVFAGWYGGNMLAEALGVNELLGPVLGLSAGLLVVVDPFRVIWTRPTLGRTVTSAEVVDAV